MELDEIDIFDSLLFDSPTEVTQSTLSLNSDDQITKSIIAEVYFDNLCVA